MVFHPVKALLLALTLPLISPTPAAAATIHVHSTRPESHIANGAPLRIMALGASNTYGTASSDGTGYRGPLRAHLVAQGNPVNMVGSRQSGRMPDSDVEGWPGYRIEQVHAKAREALPRWKPNVVLINAGTNDAAQGFNVAAAGARMEALVREVWAASPRAVVVLSTLLVNRKAATEENVRVINAQYVALVGRLRGEGKKVVLAEMHLGAGPGLGDMVDDTHPNDVGYGKMADVWYGAIVAASDAGWLQAPEPVADVPDHGA